MLQVRAFTSCPKGCCKRFAESWTHGSVLGTAMLAPNGFPHAILSQRRNANRCRDARPTSICHELSKGPSCVPWNPRRHETCLTERQTGSIQPQGKGSFRIRASNISVQDCRLSEAETAVSLPQDRGKLEHGQRNNFLRFLSSCHIFDALKSKVEIEQADTSISGSRSRLRDLFPCIISVVEAMTHLIKTLNGPKEMESLVGTWKSDATIMTEAMIG